MTFVTDKESACSKIQLRKFALLFSLPLFFLNNSMAAAWDKTGHEATSIVTERLLSKSVLGEVRRLIRFEGAESIASLSNWADIIRIEMLPNAPMHSVRIPFNAEGYVPERDCVRRCVVQAISNYVAILSNKKLDDAQRLEALKYIVHLVVDLHQPLHAADRVGREPVSVRNPKRVITLHKAWDTDLIALRFSSASKLAERILKLAVPTNDCDNPALWANESHSIVRSFVYQALGPVSFDHPVLLSEQYIFSALEIIEKRLAQASARLACVLENSLKEKD